MRQYRDRQRSVAQLIKHIEVWIAELGSWELVQRSKIETWTYSAAGSSIRSISLGDSWSNRHGIHKFTSDLLSLPAAAVSDSLCELRLDFGGEALVTLTDASGTQLDRFGANPYHRAFGPVPTVPFRVTAEVAARTLFGIPNRDPKLIEAAFVDYDPSVRSLRRRLDILCSTARSAVSKALARDLLDAAEHAISLLRLPTATAEVGPRHAGEEWAAKIWERSFEPTDTPAPISEQGRSSVVAALSALDDSLKELRETYPKHGRILLSGHAHIDYVWLWPQAETLNKITRTFNSVVSLMRNYPDFCFNQSSSLYYDHIAELDAVCLEEIKAAVKRGQWEPIGGMFVECDTNMPSAEAFSRHFLFGQRRFTELFGQPCRTAWLPDTFGFTAAMPQIMKAAGINALITIKASWSETNEMPENLFHWEGNDGTRVLVHTFNAFENNGYNMVLRPEALIEVWGNHTGHDLCDTVIASYGWGDGGGGPTSEQIESIPLLNLMPGLPEVKHGLIQPHIDQLARKLEGATCPVWRGEIYLEYHRGTLTTQGRVKQLNRKAEHALVAAEAMAELAQMAGVKVLQPSLAADWRLTLRNQFHDILPGSSIREAYEQAIPELEGVHARAEAFATQSLTAIASKFSDEKGVKGVAVANLSGSAKLRWQIESTEPLPATLNPQAINDGYVVTSDTLLAPISITFAVQAVETPLRITDSEMENSLVRLKIDAQGRLASVFDKRCGRELIDVAANRIMVYPNDLPRKFDAWDIEPGFAAGGYELTEAVTTLTASGPHMGEITVSRRVSASTIVTRYRLWANSARVDMVTEIDWHDRRTYLRATFPLNVMAESAAFDQAIGVTTRATHDNTTWQKAQFEACGHRFVSLGEADWGGALLSASKYGMSAKANVLTISLIRGPMYPDMLADEGTHRFTYSLLPHDGRWWAPEVQAEADLVNDPLRFVSARSSQGFCHQPISWSGMDARFHCLKPAEDGNGTILRLSESAGRRGRFDIKFSEIPHSVNILENDVAESAVTRPFELRSWRITNK